MKRKLPLLLMAVAFMSLSVLAQENAPEKKDRKSKPDVEKMAKELDLKPEQKVAWTEIRENSKKEMKAIKDNAALSREEKMEQAKKIKAENNKKLMAILDKTQQEKMKAMRKEQRKEVMKNRKEKDKRGKKIITPIDS